MLDFIDAIWLFIGAIIVSIILGLIAGFSPTLYMTQVGVATSKKAFTYMLSIMGGVVIAILFLTILFQFFHLNTLVSTIDTTVNALFVSVVFNVFIGAALIAGGIWYIKKKDPVDGTPQKPKKSGVIALGIFGFVRTITSISGVTATFIASNVIAEASVGPLLRLVLTVIFLAATIIPFIGIVLLWQARPDKLSQGTEYVKRLLRKLNYRPVIGFGAILFGSSIIIFNLFMAVFY